jgi:hypothetical protein
MNSGTGPIRTEMHFKTSVSTCNRRHNSSKIEKYLATKKNTIHLPSIKISARPGVLGKTGVSKRILDFVAAIADVDTSKPFKEKKIL